MPTGMPNPRANASGTDTIPNPIATQARRLILVGGKYDKVLSVGRSVPNGGISLMALSAEGRRTGI